MRYESYYQKEDTNNSIATGITRKGEMAWLQAGGKGKNK
jgi:hypothetical protein